MKLGKIRNLTKSTSPPAYPAYRQAGGRQANPSPGREGLNEGIFDDILFLNNLV
jgi:hypothetical protein